MVGPVAARPHRPGGPAPCRPGRPVRRARRLPGPRSLRALDLDLPGRKAEYLKAVAEAALDHRLDGAALRAVEPERALHTVQQIKVLGPFAAELVVIRGANAPDMLPQNERRLQAGLPQMMSTRAS